MADLSALGSAQEIAAAAMSAAGLDSLMQQKSFETDQTSSRVEPRTTEAQAQAKHEHTASTDAAKKSSEGDADMVNIRPKAEAMTEATAEATAEAPQRQNNSRGAKRTHDETSDERRAEVRKTESLPPSASFSPSKLYLNSSMPTMSVKSESQKAIPTPSKIKAPMEQADSRAPSKTNTFGITAARLGPTAFTKSSGMSGMRNDTSTKLNNATASTAVAPSSSTSSSGTSASAALALLSGIHNLEAVAQAAMGLDANGNPLPGNEESHRTLAEAVKRLSAAQGGATATSSNFDLTQSSTGNAHTTASSGDGEDPTIKRFQCHLCERAFARAYNLNTHLATHDPDPAKSKPFSCPYPTCKADGGRSFSRKHDLQRHVASTHENEPIPDDEEEIDENGTRISIVAKLGLATPGRKFRCEECGRAFVRRDTLRRHQCVPQSTASSPPSQVTSVDVAPIPSKSLPATTLTNTGATTTPAQIPMPMPMPSGLSLYTSTAPTLASNVGKPAKTNGKSAKSAADAPFYPAGLSYESLSREVQDMAMQLVAQATSYNQTHSGTSGQAQLSSNIPSSRAPQATATDHSAKQS